MNEKPKKKNTTTPTLLTIILSLIPFQKGKWIYGMNGNEHQRVNCSRSFSLSSWWSVNVSRYRKSCFCSSLSLSLPSDPIKFNRIHLDFTVVKIVLSTDKRRERERGWFWLKPPWIHKPRNLHKNQNQQDKHHVQKKIQKRKRGSTLSFSQKYCHYYDDDYVWRLYSFVMSLFLSLFLSLFPSPQYTQRQ